MKPHAKLQVVWLKRDLRIHDHRPLVAACQRGSVVVLWVYEDTLRLAEDVDARHLEFIEASLQELEGELRQRGGFITYRRGTFPSVFQDLHARYGIEAIYSHQEIGTERTYARDRAVKLWCRASGVAWHEYRQYGVVRGRRRPSGWATQWSRFVREPLAAPPDHIPAATHVPRGEPGRPDDLVVTSIAEMSQLQRAGADAGRVTLDSFLESRGVFYLQSISNPSAAADYGSRLSPYLAYGNLSLREVFHATHQRVHRLGESPIDQTWRRSLESFGSRLRWHCHFMQKLENRPRLEFENLAPSVTGLREPHFDDERFERWRRGLTGYPLVDACMRCVAETGWLNFRMRAMVVSFAAYDLWLHWRRPAQFLARCFTDYEPGIHFPQMQMQSGTTGLNALRIYDPTKQAVDHDPAGRFICRFVPELGSVPEAYLARPWTMPWDLQQRVGCVIGRHYPRPIVSHGRAARAAHAQLAQTRATATARADARELWLETGSRRRRRTRRWS